MLQDYMAREHEFNLMGFGPRFSRRAPPLLAPSQTEVFAHRHSVQCADMLLTGAVDKPGVRGPVSFMGLFHVC